MLSIQCARASNEVDQAGSGVVTSMAAAGRPCCMESVTEAVAHFANDLSRIVVVNATKGEAIVGKQMPISQIEDR